MNKIFLIATIFELVLFSAFGQKTAPGKIIGVWLSEYGNLKIEIYKAGPQYFGKQVWGDFIYDANETTPKKDVNNSNKMLRGRNLNNLIVLTNLDYDYGVYDGGIFYDYKSGKSHKSIFKLCSENILKVRDYSFVSFFGKTTIWIRVQ